MNLTSINRRRNNKDKINQDREPWQSIEGRKTQAKSDRDRQAGRQMAREREWWANSQQSRQTTRERKRLPASQGGADRQAGRQTDTITEVSR